MGTPPDDVSVAPRTAAIVLAAGGGDRFDGPTHKLLAAPGRRHDGDAATIVERVVRRAVDAAIGPVIVVAGAVSLDAALRDVGDVGDVQIVTNARWRRGQATSLATGLETARLLDARAVVVGLGDQPSVTASAWRTVASGRDPITVATYDGRHGNPVRLAAEVWPLLPTDGDRGARALMHVRPDLVGEVACEGSAVDIDTMEDLERWQNS